MYYYFYIKFKDNADLFIVRIKYSESVRERADARKAAIKLMIEKLHGVTEDDFKIMDFMLWDLVSQLHFVNDITQFSIVKDT